MKKRWTEPPGNHRRKSKQGRLPKGAESQILGFRKTNHFSSRQKARKISDSLLARILWTLRPTPVPTSIIVRERELRKLAISGKIEDQYKSCRKDMVLVVHGQDLITCFTTEENSYITSSSIQAIIFFTSNS